MFTGLIADLGSVSALDRDTDGARLRIRTRLAAELQPGDSIAVDGVCLTATAIADGEFAAAAMTETLRRSALVSLGVGSRVNLEPALRADGRLGGHVVQGHVDGVGVVREIREDGFARVLRIDAGADTDTSIDTGTDAGTDTDAGAPALGRYLVEKGSVAVNGVSLTVSALSDGGFEVSLIPETLQRTNLGELRVGDRVNLEADVLAKYVERLMEAHV